LRTAEKRHKLTENMLGERNEIN